MPHGNVGDDNRIGDARQRRLLTVAPAIISILPILLIIGSNSCTHAGNNAESSAESLRSQEHIAQVMQWGEYALARERFAEAEARFNDVLRLDWNHPRAFSLLQETRQSRTRALADWEHAGRDAEARGDLHRAMEYFGKITVEDSTASNVRARLIKLQKRDQAGRLIQSGLSKFILEDYAAATLDFEQALTLVPGDTLAAAYRDRAEQKMAGGTSMAQLRADTVIWAKYSDALKKLRTGDLAGAEEQWNAVLAKYPGNEAVRSNLEQIARRRKQELTSEDQTP